DRATGRTHRHPALEQSRHGRAGTVGHALRLPGDPPPDGRDRRPCPTRLAAVREWLSAGQAVLAAVERWRSLSAGPVADTPVTGGPPGDAGRPRPPVIERIALLPAQDPARTWSPEQVHQALEVPVAGVYSSMSRLESAAAWFVWTTAPTARPRRPGGGEPPV